MSSGPLLDKSALVIIVSYNVSIGVKMIGLIVQEATDHDFKILRVSIYSAIIVIWTMMYIFVFEMKIVQVKISSNTAED